jgi:hypothetical protein
VDLGLDDSVKVSLGTGRDADIYYDGTNLVLTPDVAGSGYVSLDGEVRVPDGHGMVIGAAAQQTIGSAVSELQLLGTAEADSSVTLGRWTASSAGPFVRFFKSRNAAIGSSTIVQDDDRLGTIIAGADDGNDFVHSAAAIFFEVDGTPGMDDLPGRIIFATTPDGDVGSDERLRIDSAGVITATASFIPEADGTRDLGVQTTAQWANLWADSVNGADICMANGVRMLESELFGYGRGWAIGHSEKWVPGKAIWAASPEEQRRYLDGERPVFAVTDDFIEFKGRRLTEAVLDRLLEVANV